MSLQPESEKRPIRVMMLGPALEQMGGIATVENLIIENASSDIEICHIPTHNYGSFLFRTTLFVKAIWKMIWQLSTQEIDAVHVHLSQRGSAFRVAILILLILPFRKPIILHPHGSEFRLFYAKLSALPKWFLKSVFQRCQHFIVLSESWKRFYVEILSLAPEQVTVLANPVKLPPHPPQRRSSGTMTFLFLGRIGERKGAFDLIHAFSTVCSAVCTQQPTPAKLLLAGDGELDRAQQLIESLDLTDRVHLLGWIRGDQRDKLLSEADVFTLPSYNEGLPMALLEAMGWGLPTISTPVGGIPELVTSGKDGLLVEPGNLEQLSQTMQALIEDENLRLSLGKNARERVEPLNIHSYCSALLDLYRSAKNREAPRKSIQNAV